MWDIDWKSRADALIQSVLLSGADKAGIISSHEIVLDRSFREMCASNVCGNYGRCWMCPPDVGDIDILMNRLEGYNLVLVYQTIQEMKKSNDYDEMLQAGDIHNRIAQKLRSVFVEAGIQNALHIGAGGCRLCSICAKKLGQPCCHPKKAMPSLEAYGINVAKMAEAADMEYMGRQGSVHYFGAVFFNL
ncbi:MAG: DUF2284 domain-containing protein [Clostridia bacterium]|nr:DUF2284 domain-containing protein [Clostridia bacterium]